MLHNMVQACQSDDPDPPLADLCFWLHGLSKLWCEDLLFTSTFLQIKLRSSKTDQFRQGDVILAAHLGKPTCPAIMVEQYMSKGELVGKLELLFGPLTKKWEEASLWVHLLILDYMNCYWKGCKHWDTQWTSLGFTV